MKNRFFIPPAFAALICLFTSVLHAQSDSVQWYQGGALTIWQRQPDVFAFHCTGGGGLPCTIDTSLIAKVVHQVQREDKAVEIYFKPTASEADKDLLKTIIKAQPQFEQEFLAITRDKLLDWESQQWYVLDDQLLVNFRNPNIPAAQVAAFATAHQLDLVAAPDPGLPVGGNYAYLFRMGAALHGVRTVAEECLKIAGGDTSVLNVEPNFVNLRMPMPTGLAEKIRLEGAGPGLACPLTDTLYDWMWHIDNQGTFKLPGTPTSLLDADADICECWNAGWTGKDIKIAVISMGGFDYTHPDLTTTLQDGWDCSVVPCTLLSKTIVPTGSDIHGTYATSLLGADVNNITGASGMVPGAKIIPIRLGTGDVFDSVMNTAAAVRGIEMALNPLVEADIAVLNFWKLHPSEALMIAIRSNIKFGRHDPVTLTNRGMVIIATTGGEFGHDSNLQYFPAGYDSVLSVIGSTPRDQCKGIADGFDLPLWGPYGSHFGAWYDVAAPSAIILGADHSGPSGLGNTINGDDYAIPYNQGFAQATVVAAIAAMILEKKPDLKWDKVVNTITAGAEKVGGYAYTLPGGKCMEMGHGRVSCINSINLIPVGSDEADLSDHIQIEQDGDGNIWVEFADGYEGLMVNITLKAITGGNLSTWQLLNPQGREHFDLPDLASGVYLITIQNVEGFTTEKLVIW